MIPRCPPPNMRMQRTGVARCARPGSPRTRRPLGGHTSSLWLVAALALAMRSSSASAQYCESVVLPYCDPLRIAGTFSSMRFDPERQVAEGMELRIVTADCGYQATVQFGEGQGSDANWSRLLLVDVQFTSDLWPLHVPWPVLVPTEDADDFWFSIPPGTGHAGHFYGVIYRDRLDGLFQSADGRESRVSLPRVESEP
jgi:hypothetical protein